MAELGLVTFGYRSDPAVVLAKQHMAGCSTCKARRRQARANRSRRELDQIRRDLGLVKTPYGWE